MTIAIRIRHLASCTRLLSSALVAAACVLAAPPALQAQPSGTTLNFKDADLNAVIEAVSAVTGRRFIVDPRVRANVTVISPGPMSPDAVWEAFLSILQVYGFIAVPSGPVIKILPDANARQMPALDLPDKVSGTSDEIVTQVIQVRNVNAAQLVPVLRPLIPQYGHLVTVTGTNTLIISDRANNVSRIQRIIQRIDQAGDDDIDIVRLENASSAEIVRVVNSMTAGQQAQPEVIGSPAKVVGDDRTNSILISGEKTQRLRMKTLITYLDTPLDSGGGDTQVRYLRFADAETIAAKLKEQIQGIVASTPGAVPPGGAANAAAGGGGGGGVGGGADKSVFITSDAPTNALIVTAPIKVRQQINTIVDKLDIRRQQVSVEAIIVELQATKAAEFGTNFLVDGTSSNNKTVPLGIFNRPVGGTGIGSLAGLFANAASNMMGNNGNTSLGNVALPNDTTFGGGRFTSGDVNFLVLLRALRNDTSANILQQPSIITLDNEEAEIKVAQEVPFITGQFTNTGGGSNNGSVNPFQTVQREEVGTILKLTPQISDSESVILKIEQESSSLVPSSGSMGAVDLITNKRTITTKVVVEDGGVIVLGGLMSDSSSETESKVPILGSIPLIGNLFKTKSGSKDKRSLMVFIRPTILRNSQDTAIETNAKYNRLRDQQLRQRKVPLLPRERQPLLPPIEELSRYADPAAQPKASNTPAPAATEPQQDAGQTASAAARRANTPPPSPSEPLRTRAR
jgi:general secretion pathway protein D